MQVQAAGIKNVLQDIKKGLINFSVAVTIQDGVTLNLNASGSRAGKRREELIMPGVEAVSPDLRRT